MHRSLRPPILLSCVLLAVTSVVCGGNAPLPVGGAGAGAAGHGGSTPTGSGTAGTSLMGHAGAPPTGTGPGVAGAFGGVGTAGSLGTAGVVGTAGTSPVGGTGEGGGTGIFMCGSPTLPTGSCVPGAFKRPNVGCQCQDGFPCVCPGVGCIDPMTDPDNCGLCGIKCGPTSTCNGGVCGPAPVVVVPPQQSCGLMDLAVGGGMLYWTDPGHAAVKRMPLAGGGAQTIGNGEKPSNIAVAGTMAVWMYSSGSIRLSFDGAPPSFLLSGGAQIGGLALTADGTVFFSTGNDVMRTSIKGEMPVAVVNEVKGGIPAAIAAIDSNHIAFPTQLNGDVELVTLIPGQIVNCGQEDPATGELVPNSNCKRLARSQGELFTDGIIANPQTIVWADGPNLKMESAAGNGTFDIVAQSDNPVITGFATIANGATVYFSDLDAMLPGNGVIYKTLLGPNQVPIRIARGQNGPRSVVVGDKKVYWSTSDCTIMSQNL